MRLYIIRHADPDYENNTLTPAGHQEANALARRLAGHGLDYIYTSPITRAAMTAQYTADLLKIEPITDEWLIEIPGWEIEELGGIPAWDIPGEVFRAKQPVGAKNYIAIMYKRRESTNPRSTKRSMGVGGR